MIQPDYSQHDFDYLECVYDDENKLSEHFKEDPVSVFSHLAVSGGVWASR